MKLQVDCNAVAGLLGHFLENEKMWAFILRGSRVPLLASPRGYPRADAQGKLWQAFWVPELSLEVYAAHPVLEASRGFLASGWNKDLTGAK